MAKRLTFERFDDFKLVGVAGGIGKAAGGNEILKRQFTRHIGDLENYFMTDLLQRHTRKGVVAAENAALSEAGKKLLQLWSFFRKELQEYEDQCKARPIFLRLGAGDRLLHWFIIPVLSQIQEKLAESQIELHNCSTREVLERIHSFSLDFGIIRSSEVPKGLRRTDFRSRFNYSLFVRNDLNPRKQDARWVMQNIAMACVERYQGEFLAQAELRRIRPKVRLLCTTFPQARRAVSVGYAAILPTAAFSSGEIGSIQKLPLPFSMPAFERGEAGISIVWNRRVEKMTKHFPEVISVFESVFSANDPA